jgi:hypothetical protein
MDENIRNLIIRDYKESFKNLSDIISGKEKNRYVLKPNQYLTPTIMTKLMNLDDKDGEFCHYNKICETLEKLLAGEKVKYICQFKNAPEKIKNLLLPVYIEN